ncbi:HpcH/HpaI aldolase/citrate lyase family protein [Eggerthella guodeyinii]|uniref:HpcH/HpaI aldolase/citrate lyase family protein n=1 Tax=Eggerthella guodeyinii TaxID=2690837 RepID=A0A6L7IWK3_9ACTN|nr:HpcH/HpaI aldolase/citrate lyase family protein [Eggerthella guodeyinii]QOS67611.1 HpcH/HpaI aldolase/citrate lyase family protein [Eggerthella guodeyinii]
MRHHQHNENYNFVVSPESFNKYSEKKFLAYCLGATMYMPGTKDFTRKILDRDMPGLTSIVLDFEDACRAEDVEDAEANVLHLLSEVSAELDKDAISYDSVPLVFCRVRSPEQFERFSKQLDGRHVRALAGINFPKFDTTNGNDYCRILRELNDRCGEIVYGMPILESERIAFKESRIDELLGIRRIVDENSDLILHIRVGGTDFSGCFGVRRGMDYTIYDIMTVRACLMDIMNVFGRNNDYVVSGPVWEYFRASGRMKFEDIPAVNVDNLLVKRTPIFNNEVDGLLREVILDKANGFVGKTVIHPTHVKFVNALEAVTREEYEDAAQILEASSGVLKSAESNKMNEIGPHHNWAEKVLYRARAYGVVENESEYLKLFFDGEGSC